MNDDMKLLALLHRYAQRRMVAVLGQVEAHLGCDAATARDAVARLEAKGLAYLEGPTVRLTLPGFAHAVAAARVLASVHPLRRRGHAPRSHAA